MNMGQVTALLNSIGWTLPVLPELDDLTVGTSKKNRTLNKNDYQFCIFRQSLSAVFYPLPLSLFVPSPSVLT